MRMRAQAIIIRDEKMLFAYGIATSHNQLRHSFIGGGVEEYEDPTDAVLRELMEEANVAGRIVFEIPSNPDEDHRTFFVDIGEQVPTLGHDPEDEALKLNDRGLKGLMWIDMKDKHLFTDIDRAYFARIHDECMRRDYHPEWIAYIKDIIAQAE